MNVINMAGTEINFESAVVYMDDEIRQEIENARWWDSDQDYFTAYEKAHAEKYGEEWELSKANPCW